MRHSTIILIIILFPKLCISQNSDIANSINKIPVLNFGTFHMGKTNDERKTEYDEFDKKNQQEVHEIAKQLAEFKPTVILVEYVPEHNEELKSSYDQYCREPDMLFEHPSEVELLAYELGRLCDVTQIYGIDHKMSYNYKIGHEIENQIDSLMYNQYYSNPYQFYPEIDMSLFEGSTMDKLTVVNQAKTLDFLITINADMLSHVGTDDGFEGADEAAKYYQRNLRMYSNLNRIKLNKQDRVFILMGGSHTAFFRDFISRSPKYKMVDTFKYLQQ